MVLPTPLHPEVGLLPNAVPASFEMFYRATFRRVVGRRVRSSIVHAAYGEWSRGETARRVGYRQLRRYMLSLGHAHIRSNGIQYLDVAFAVDVPDVADTFAVVPIDASAPAGIDVTIMAIDATIATLARLRRMLTGGA